MRSAPAAAAVLAWALACAAWADDVQPKDAGGAKAREAQFEMRGRLSLEAKPGRPFYKASPPLLVDRGKLLYLGRGAFHGPDLIYLAEVESLEERTLRAPTPAFAAEHPELSLAPKIEELLCYDRTDGRAGLVIKDVAQRKTYFLWWDLAKNRISKALLIGEKGPETRWLAVSPLGYDPARRECVFQTERNDGAMTSVTSPGGPYIDSVLAAGGEELRTIATFEGTYMTSHGPYLDLAHQRAVVTEVTELPGAKPRGYLVDLSSGGVRPFPIPQDVYSFAFDPNGQMLFAYGVKPRELWAINPTTGAAVRRVRVGDIGHGLGFIGDTLVVIGNVRIHLLDKGTLGHKAQIGSRKIVPGLVNCEHSLVLPGSVVAINNFYDLYVARLNF